jgi:hypothetical protein
MYAQRFTPRRMFAASIRVGLGALPLLLVLLACSSGTSTPSAGACRTSADCSGFESCYLPGSSNCGIARRNECSVGAACNAGIAVQVDPDSGDVIDSGVATDSGDAADSGDAGALNGVCVALGGCGGSQCVRRCSDDKDCGGSLVGHCAVSTGICGPPLCTTDAECKNPNFACSIGALRTCVPKRCTADTECSGFCSSGTCSAFGSCQLPAP